MHVKICLCSRKMELKVTFVAKEEDENCRKVYQYNIRFFFKYFMRGKFIVYLS